jgi:predicted PurR-regulated permease PerM
MRGWSKKINESINMKQGKDIVLYGALVVMGLYFLFHGLVLAKSFIAPLVLALVLAFLMLPVSDRLEKWGFKRIWATIVSTLTLFLVIAGFVTILLFQIRDFAEDWEEVRSQFNEMLGDLEEYLVENTPLTQASASSILGVAGTPERKESNEEKDEETGSENGEEEESDNTPPLAHEDPSNGSDFENDENGEGNEEGRDGENEEESKALGEGEVADIAEDTQDQVILVMAAVVAFITDFLVVLVYVFMFIQFRHKFKKFILRLFAPDRRERVNDIVMHSAEVSRKYLVGRLFLMVILAVMYYVGLLLSGVDNALLLALISAALSMIPVVGNFIGYFISVAVSLVTDGGFTAVIGITITYLIAQFIDTYILQPIVLGEKVGVHPFFIIFSVILGYEVWGIIGMVVSIPVFGVITIILRNVDVTKALGYLLSNKEPEDGKTTK